MRNWAVGEGVIDKTALIVIFLIFQIFDISIISYLKHYKFYSTTGTIRIACECKRFSSIFQNTIGLHIGWSFHAFI